MDRARGPPHSVVSSPSRIHPPSGADYLSQHPDQEPASVSAPKLTAKPAETLPVQRVLKEVSRRIVGQDAMIERLLVGLLTGGHILLEGVPGLAKTLAVRTLAEIINASFSRIQFTPDLLPADEIGRASCRERVWMAVVVVA